MPFFFWLDIIALSVSTVLATALALVILGSGPGRTLNRLFALFALMQTSWAVFALLLRLGLWLETGNLPLWIEISALSVAFMGPLLFTFTTRYVKLCSRWTDLTSVFGLSAVALLAVPLFEHELLFNPRLAANGSTTLDFSIWGLIVAGVPALYMVLSVVLFWKGRKSLAEPYLALGAFVLTVGFVVGGVLEVPLPVMSLTNTLSVSLVGYAVVRRQIFNPLRERAAALQQEIAERVRVEEILREKTEELDRYFSHALDLLCIADTDGRFRRLNKEWEAALGYTLEGLEGRHFLDFVHPDDLAATVKAVGQLAAQEKVTNFTNRYRHKDGSYRWIEWRSMPAGNLIYAVARDITERKRVEEVLEWRAAQLAILNDVGKQISSVLELEHVLDRATHLIQERFNYHHVAIFLVDQEDGKAVMTTRAGVFIDLFPPLHTLDLGQGMVGWVAQHGEHLLANDVRAEPRHLNFYPDVLLTRSELDVPIRIGDEVMGVLDIQSPQLDDFDENDVMVIETLAGQIAVAIENARLYKSIQEELSERKRAEETLQRYTVRLTTLHDIDQAILSAQTPQAIAKAAVEHLNELIPCNRLSVSLIDPARSEVELIAVITSGETEAGTGARYSFAEYGISGPQSLVDEVHVIDDWTPSTQLPLLSKTLLAEGIRSVVHMPLTYQGNVVGWLNLGLSESAAFKKEQIEIAREVAIQLGIAIQQAYLREQVQRHAAELEERVTERTEELTVAYQELQALSQIKDVFVANVSHELRTPIASLKLFARLLKLRPEKQESYVASLERETERLERLIEGLLMLSRLDQSRTELDFSFFDFNTLVREYVTDRTLLAKSNRLTLEVDISDGLPPICGDRSLLGQVVSILLTNAFNYTPEEGRIMVSTFWSESTQECGLRVVDTGLGILPEDQLHLFDRFYRGKAALDCGTPGTGLGLAIAKEIVDRHHGRIQAESDGQAGHGAQFTVHLPVSQPASDG